MATALDTHYPTTHHCTVTTLSWSARSQDLSPIERFWHHLGSCRKEGSFWVPSVPNECLYFTDYAKTIIFA
ncbi:hypothetical protein TNCV_4992861 [Trichonephila clavipes]|nr:hypothetical protein TNCV_4992861 [Trichonephila clavipes]